MIKCCDWYETHKGGDPRLRQALLIIQSWLCGEITADIVIARRIINDVLMSIGYDPIMGRGYDPVVISAAFLLETEETEYCGVDQETHIVWLLWHFDQVFGSTWKMYMEWKKENP